MIDTFAIAVSLSGTIRKNGFAESRKTQTETGRFPGKRGGPAVQPVFNRVFYQQTDQKTNTKRTLSARLLLSLLHKSCYWILLIYFIQPIAGFASFMRCGASKANSARKAFRNQTAVFWWVWQKFKAVAASWKLFFVVASTQRKDGKEFFCSLFHSRDHTIVHGLVENICLTFHRGEAGRALCGYFLPLHIGTVLSAAGHIGNVGSACVPALPPGRDQQLRTF